MSFEIVTCYDCSSRTNLTGKDTMLNNIVDYYSEYDEYNRLRVHHSLERIRSQEIILRYIIKHPSRIADVGGESGLYSFWLAEQGHRVTLLDLVPKHIEQAKQYSQESGIPLESLLLGNACELPFDEHAFDIVLLMGPLYHLPEKKSRVRALTEARRVLKPRGTLIVAAISRFASLVDEFGATSRPGIITFLEKLNSMNCELYLWTNSKEIY